MSRITGKSVRLFIDGQEVKSTPIRDVDAGFANDQAPAIRGVITMTCDIEPGAWDRLTQEFRKMARAKGTRVWPWIVQSPRWRLLPARLGHPGGQVRYLFVRRVRGGRHG